MMNIAKKSKRGFTLIELIVVVAIIALIVSIILASLGAAKAKARDAERHSDLHQIANAISLYFNENGSLPETTGWCTSINNPSNGWGTSFQNIIAPKYISKVPLDPVYSRNSDDAGDYFYINQDTNLGHYTLCTILETESGQDYSSTFSGCANWTSSYNYCESY